MHELTDGEVTLLLSRDAPADPKKEWLRSFHYSITSTQTSEVMGKIDLRIGYTTNVVMYGGHIGYSIDMPFRGNHFAAKACLLVKGVAIQNHMDVIWITCNPGNWASRKTCEHVGASLVEIVDLPEDNDQYKDGDRRKCRYRWILY